jgi:hypothetical protein
MADENISTAQGDEENEPDYKAMYEAAVRESRKWEGRAKANSDKAAKWDEASAGSESVLDRLAKLEAENQAMKDAEARHALVAKVAGEVGLPASLVESLSGSDEDTLTKQAQAIAELKPKGAPNVPEAGVFPSDKANTKNNAQLFGDAIDRMLGV